MLIKTEINSKHYSFDLSQPLDISIPIRDGLNNPNCFYAPPVEFSPVIAGDFVGSTLQGGPVNFYNIKLNPHGNSTHTECVGHIAKDPHTINGCLTKFVFPSKLITVIPRLIENGDKIILKDMLEDTELDGIEAIIIRTTPNDITKKTRTYSGSNPPYLDPEAINFLVDSGIKHLLLDLPSVDREEDEGKLLSHRAFWRYPESPRTDCTITEMIFVPDAIKDGFYLLHLHIASFELDVSPSKPVLYTPIEMQ